MHQSPTPISGAQARDKGRFQSRALRLAIF